MLHITTPSDIARRPSSTYRTSNAMETLIANNSGPGGFDEEEIPAASHRSLTFGSGAFSRRMMNRYNTELDYVQQRHEQGKNIVYSRTYPDITGTAELDGNEIDEFGREVVRDIGQGGVLVRDKGKEVVVRRSREQICLETAREMMMPTVLADDTIEAANALATTMNENVKPTIKLFDPEGKEVRQKDAEKPMLSVNATFGSQNPKKTNTETSGDVRQSDLIYEDGKETIRMTLTPAIAGGPPSKENSPLLNVTNQTRMHLLRTDDEKKLSKLMRMKSIVPKLKGYPNYPSYKSGEKSSYTGPQQDITDQYLRERSSLASLKHSLKKVKYGFPPVHSAGSKTIPIRRKISGLLAGNTTAKVSSHFAERIAEIGGVKYEPTLLGLPSGLRQKITDQVILYNGPILVCSCGSCDFSWSKQPSLARSCRLLRSEILFRYYSGNQFTLVNSCLPAPSSRPVRWLATLTKDQRNMLRHVEVSTKEMASTICMMAGLGLKLIHRIPSYSIADLMQDERAAVWLTFTATSPSFRVGEVLPPVFQTAPIDLWDGGDVAVGGSRPLEDKRASMWTTGTSILGGEEEEEYDGEVMVGEMIVAGRGKVVVV